MFHREVGTWGEVSIFHGDRGRPSLTGGLISIWGPTHESERDGTLESCGRRISYPWGEGEEQLKVYPRAR